MKVIKEDVSKDIKDQLIDYVSDAVDMALFNLEGNDLNALAVEAAVPGYDASYCSEEWSQKSSYEREQAIELLTKVYMRELLADS